MSKIYVKDREGVTQEVSAEEGLTIMEIIRDAGLDIEAACGGCCACATCHLYIDKDWKEKLPKIENEEEYKKNESSIMEKALYAKFTQNDDLKDIIKSTEDALLISPENYDFTKFEDVILKTYEWYSKK